MNNANVIVRFMSLLDVALILLGVLMLALMQTAVPAPSKASERKVSSEPVLDQINFIYLFAGWKGEQNGRCFELNRNMDIGDEVSMRSDSHILKLGERKRSGPSSPSIAMLVFEEDGWFPAWSSETIANAEKAWGIKVIPIYDVSISKSIDKKVIR